MKVCRVEEMRELDAAASATYNISGHILMENAGLASVQTIASAMDIKNKRFCIFCGGGNNGGDGFVVARKLHSLGGTITVFILGDRNKYKDSAKANLQAIHKMDIDILDLQTSDQAKKILKESDVVIDAILGTGLERRPVEGKFKEIILLINDSDRPVFSLDVPSGINGDNGKVMGIAVRAKHTCTYGLPKTGNLLYPGFEYCGKLSVTHISFPPELIDEKNIRFETNDPLPIPRRNFAGHKGSFGKALFIAGSAGYLGAPYFAAMAFLKSGGGLSYLAAPQPVVDAVGRKGRELVFLPQKATESGSAAYANLDNLLKEADRTDFCVIGPGLSLHEETQQLVRDFTLKHEGPLLIDGDGLSAIKNDLDVLSKRKGTTILTPHGGEFSRLCGLSIDEIYDDPFSILQKYAKEWNSIIVLKGAHSLIGCPDGGVYINISGNCGMASAGSGDVLTGIIAAMQGLGFGTKEAVRMGVFTHGYAADLAAQTGGEDGLTAGDILENLPKSLLNIREGTVDFSPYLIDVL